MHKYAQIYYIIIKKGGYYKPPKKENFQTKMKKTSDNNIICSHNYNQIQKIVKKMLYFS